MKRVRKPPVFLVFLSWRSLGKTLGVSAVFLLLGMGFARYGAVWTTAPPSYAVAGKTVVIDAGHGGRDPGAVGRSGLTEKEITLDLALRLRRMFSRVGARVVLTRETDVDYGDQGDPASGTRKSRDIAYRVQKANESKADLLLSIHVNSFPQAVWSGAQCFYDTVHSDSKQLAVCIQDELAARLGPNRRRPLAADYKILTATVMPSVTVEVGFISNPREEKLLAEEKYRERLAEAIFAGTVNFLVQKQKRAGFLPVDRELPVSAPGKFTAPPEGIFHLYFGAPDNKDMALWVEEREFPPGTGTTPLSRARLILEELFSGPGERSVLLPPVPPGAWLREIRLDGTAAIVDLDESLVTAVNGGGAAELLAVYAIVNTLAANLPVEEITLLVAGEEERTLGGHLFFDQPLVPRADLVGKSR